MNNFAFGRGKMLLLLCVWFSNPDQPVTGLLLHSMLFSQPSPWVTIMLHQHYINLFKKTLICQKWWHSYNPCRTVSSTLYNKCLQNLSPRTRLLRDWQASHRFSCVLTVGFCRRSIFCLHAPNWEVSFEFGGEKSSTHMKDFYFRQI